jgi:hypothetical protein
MKSRSSHAVFKTLAQSAEPCSENMKTVAKHCELHNNTSSSQLRKPLLVLLYAEHALKSFHNQADKSVLICLCTFVYTAHAV